MKAPQILKQVRLSPEDSSLQPFWTVVSWGWAQIGERIVLTSKVLNITTNRMFLLNELGDDIEKQKQYFAEQMASAQKDLLTRLEFIYRAQNHMFDDDLESADIKWMKKLT